jgi:hypothetical protein
MVVARNALTPNPAGDGVVTQPVTHHSAARHWPLCLQAKDRNAQIIDFISNLREAFKKKTH